MQTITIQKSSINIALLDQELRAALVEKCDGVSYRSGYVQVHLSGSAEAGDIQQAENIVLAHDSRQQTSEQVNESTLRTLISSDYSLWTDAQVREILAFVARRLPG